MDTLDEVLESFLSSKIDVLKERLDDPGVNATLEEMRDALKVQKKDAIITEIKNQYRCELEAEVHQKHKKELRTEKIKNTKKLIWEGLILAFVVGLATNQATEIITLIKECWPNRELLTTIICLSVFVLICIILYLVQFVKTALSIIEDSEKDG